MVYKCINIIQSYLFPHVCSLCGQTSALALDLCEGCLHDLQASAHVCRQCGLAIGSQAPSTLCGQCLQDPPPFHTTLAAFRYEPPLTRLIADLKFNNKHRIALLLANAWLHEFANREVALPEALLPVPMHRRRVWSRGYNQALEIARPLSQHFHIPLLTDHVIRTRYIRPQTELDARLRKQNVKGSFQVVKELCQKHVAIVDDVVTTASTVKELSRVLSNAGVKRIDVWCVARAPDWKA